MTLPHLAYILRQISIQKRNAHQRAAIVTSACIRTIESITVSSYTSLSESTLTDSGVSTFAIDSYITPSTKNEISDNSSIIDISGSSSMDVSTQSQQSSDLNADSDGDSGTDPEFYSDGEDDSDDADVDRVDVNESGGDASASTSSSSSGTRSGLPLGKYGQYTVDCDDTTTSSTSSSTGPAYKYAGASAYYGDDRDSVVIEDEQVDDPSSKSDNNECDVIATSLYSSVDIELQRCRDNEDEDDDDDDDDKSCITTTTDTGNNTRKRTTSLLPSMMIERNWNEELQKLMDAYVASKHETNELLLKSKTNQATTNSKQQQSQEKQKERETLEKDDERVDDSSIGSGSNVNSDDDACDNSDGETERKVMQEYKTQLELLSKMRQLSAEFKKVCEHIAITIITEKDLPLAARTYKPTNRFGGTCPFVFCVKYIV